MDKSTFSIRLKELRKENKVTQKELANYLNLTSNSICEWENSRSEPSISSLSKISSFFKCSIDYLVGREDDFGNIIILDDNARSLTSQEQSLLQDFRKLVPETQNYIIGIVHDLASVV